MVDKNPILWVPATEPERIQNKMNSFVRDRKTPEANGKTHTLLWEIVIVISISLVFVTFVRKRCGRPPWGIMLLLITLSWLACPHPPQAKFHVVMRRSTLTM